MPHSNQHYIQSPFTSEKTLAIAKVFHREATTRFELVMTVLQTGALPLGYVALYNYSCIHTSDSKGNRTPVTAVKGRCLNRLTMEP